MSSMDQMESESSASKRPGCLSSALQEDQILVTQLLEVMHNAGLYREQALAVLAIVQSHVEAMPKFVFV